MSKKEYSKQEDISSPLNEPQAAYGISADHLRMEMMREALRIDDTVLLSDALDYIRGLVQPRTTGIRPPCQFTLEELNEVLDKSEEDIKAGRVYKHEDLPKLRPEWKLQ